MSESQSPKIIETVLTVPAIVEGAEPTIPTPLSTISAVFGHSDALEQEAESRKATEEIRQNRVGDTGLRRNKKRVRKPKLHTTTSQPGQGVAPYQQLPGATRIAIQRSPYHHGYGGPAMAAGPVNTMTGPYQQQPSPYLVAGYGPGFAFSPRFDTRFAHGAPSPNPYALPAAAVAAVTNASTPPSQLTDKQRSEVALEDEYDRSRGAYFRNLPPLPVAAGPPEMRMGRPTTGVAEMERSDAASMMAEVVEEEEEEEEEEKKEEGIEERLRRMEEKMDRILGLLEGRAGEE